MGNEENKKGCCEEKEKCEHGMTNCCQNWKNCHMMKWILVIVALIIAFCLGSQWGEMKGEGRGSRYEKGRMMNLTGDRFEKQIDNTSSSITGEVKVDVAENPIN